MTLIILNILYYYTNIYKIELPILKCYMSMIVTITMRNLKK